MALANGFGVKEALDIFKILECFVFLPHINTLGQDLQHLGKFICVGAGLYLNGIPTGGNCASIGSAQLVNILDDFTHTQRALLLQNILDSIINATVQCEGIKVGFTQTDDDSMGAVRNTGNINGMTGDFCDPAG